MRIKLSGRDAPSYADSLTNPVKRSVARRRPLRLWVNVAGVNERVGNPKGKPDGVVAIVAADVDDYVWAMGDGSLDHLMQFSLVGAKEAGSSMNTQCGDVDLHSGEGAAEHAGVGRRRDALPQLEQTKVTHATFNGPACSSREEWLGD